MTQFAAYAIATLAFCSPIQAAVGQYAQPPLMDNRIAAIETNEPMENRTLHRVKIASQEDIVFKRVTPAPLWLVQRMDALLEMPPPSLEGIHRQINASMAIRQKLIAKRRS
jgi:hypothetical protein